MPLPMSEQPVAGTEQTPSGSPSVWFTGSLHFFVAVHPAQLPSAEQFETPGRPRPQLVTHLP